MFRNVGAMLTLLLKPQQAVLPFKDRVVYISCFQTRNNLQTNLKSYQYTPRRRRDRMITPSLRWCVLSKLSISQHMFFFLSGMYDAG